jgi:hypothetical protein
MLPYKKLFSSKSAVKPREVKMRVEGTASIFVTGAD